MSKGEPAQLFYQPDRNVRPDISGESDGLFFGRLTRKYPFSEGAQSIITHVGAVRKSVFDIWQARTADILVNAKQSLDFATGKISQYIVNLDPDIQSGAMMEFAEFDRDFWDTPVSIRNPILRRIDDSVSFKLARFDALPISSLEQRDDCGRVVQDAVFQREQVIICLLTKGNINISSVIAASRKGIG